IVDAQLDEPQTTDYFRRDAFPAVAFFRSLLSELCTGFLGASVSLWFISPKYRLIMFSIISCRPDTLAPEFPLPSMYFSSESKSAFPDSIWAPMPASHEA